MNFKATYSAWHGRWIVKVPGDPSLIYASGLTRDEAEANANAKSKYERWKR